jgi:hypothetical protein
MGWKVNNLIYKGYFLLQKNNALTYTINYWTDRYNIDFNDYYIIKATRLFKIINVDDISNYAGVICFHKSMYSLEYINLWFNFLNTINNRVPYLAKPFPPEYMLNKIKVIQ